MAPLRPALYILIWLPSLLPLGFTGLVHTSPGAAHGGGWQQEVGHERVAFVLGTCFLRVVILCCWWMPGFDVTENLVQKSKELEGEL